MVGESFVQTLKTRLESKILCNITSYFKKQSIKFTFTLELFQQMSDILTLNSVNKIQTSKNVLTLERCQKEKRILKATK